jgi:hypothetical protein
MRIQLVSIGPEGPKRVSSVWHWQRDEGDQD